MDIQKTLLAVVLSITVLLAFDYWNGQHRPPVSASPATPTAAPSASVAAPAPNPTTLTQAPAAGSTPNTSTGSAGRIRVETDLYRLEIDRQGGEIRKLALKKYRERTDAPDAVTLLYEQGNRRWTQQSLFSAAGQNAQVVYVGGAADYHLAAADNALEVRLTGMLGGLEVEKILTFQRNSYAISQQYRVTNRSDAPWAGQIVEQFVRDGAFESSMILPVFTGAITFNQEKFTKHAFTDLDTQAVQQPLHNGWAGMMDHYFLAAVLPTTDQPGQLFSRASGDGYYQSGVSHTIAAIAPGQTATLQQQIFLGPKEQEVLNRLDRGLIRAVDYGWLTVIAKPFFQIMDWFHGLVHNWGLSIILLTLVVKLAFFPLTAASYKSMANMRRVQPKIAKLKERFGDDKQKMGQAMMELYKTEKINPLSGCLPIVIQIPFFIALYWVLLESVELRQAPFMLWIQDLAAKDPYYVLPVLMGASMLVQTWLNPPAPDPIQQKIMYMMPVLFSVFFAFFPSGLVLYWLVNNLISIAQQWYITRKVESGAQP